MINGGSLAGIGAFVYFAVMFTKLPFTKLIKDPEWSNWVIRLWALVLGIVGAYVNLRLTTSGLVSQTQAYTVLLGAAVATVGAILGYHIGQPGFVDVLAGGAATTTVTVAQPPPVVRIAESTPPAETTPPAPVPPPAPLPAPLPEPTAE